MKLALRIIYNDGVHQDTDAVFADFVAFERTWNRSISKLEEEIRLTDLAWLSWHSQKRQGKVTEPFDPQWLNKVEEVEIRDTEEPDSPLAINQPTV